MFKWRIVSRSNVNGKVHSFQKDFDDYDDYQEFLVGHPEFNTQNFLDTFWNSWKSWDPFLAPESPLLLADTRYLPEGVDLDKYEKKRFEKQIALEEKSQKKLSLERAQSYLDGYVQENPDDTDAKKDLEKIEKELKELENNRT